MNVRTTIHACAPNTGRVTLTGNCDSGEITWVEVYDADGNLTGCGPTPKLAPEWAQDQIAHRADMCFLGSMYWRSVVDQTS